MLAARAANANARPWVLDPVGTGATSYRTSVARDLAALGPTVIRGNASEIMALAGVSASGKGVDSGDSVAAAEAAARQLAQATGAIVCVTGAVDLVVSPAGTRADVANGHPLMPRVTALGCALTGIVAAFAATTDDPFEACVSALAYYGVAGELAGHSTTGVGTFSVRFLDALHSLDAATVNNAARITIA